MQSRQGFRQNICDLSVNNGIDQALLLAHTPESVLTVYNCDQSWLWFSMTPVSLWYHTQERWLTDYVAGVSLHESYTISDLLLRLCYISDHFSCLRGNSPTSGRNLWAFPDYLRGAHEAVHKFLRPADESWYWSKQILCSGSVVLCLLEISRGGTMANSYSHLAEC